MFRNELTYGLYSDKECENLITILSKIIIHEEWSDDRLRNHVITLVAKSDDMDLITMCKRNYIMVTKDFRPRIFGPILETERILLTRPAE